MNNEDYVSYELALALKKCGFDEQCDHYYTPNKTHHIVKSNALAPEITNNRFLDEIDDGCCTAVPLWQAQKWLREAKGIDVLVWNCACGYGWEISKANAQSRGTTLIVYDDNGEDKDSGMWLTYENALYAGIVVALQFIDN